MKTIILFTLLLLSILARGQNDPHKNKTAAKTLLKIQGCLLFIMSEPVEPYNHVASLPLPSGVFSTNISEEFEKLIKKARKKYPYFNGVVIYRDMKRFNLIRFEDTEITAAGFKIGQRIVHKKGNDLMYGEIKELNTYRLRGTFKYLNKYGEEKVIERKLLYLSPISDKDYKEKIAAMKKEIETHKYDVGTPVIWGTEQIKIGEVRALDQETHLAKVEFLDKYGDVKIEEVPFLEATKITIERYKQLLKEKEAERGAKIFKVGELVAWRVLQIEKRGEIVKLDNINRKASIKYTKSGKEIIIKKEYIKLIKISSKIGQKKG